VISPVRPRPAASPTRPIRLCLTDDETLFRETLATTVTSQPDMTVVAQARDGAESVRQVLAHRPDMVLMDISLPRMDGLEATLRIKQELPTVKVIAMTAWPRDETFRRALRVGVDSFILKDARLEELVGTIRLTYAGSRLFNGRLLATYLNSRKRTTSQDELTTREQEVLAALAAGLSNAAIATRLRISQKTVRNHISNVYAKLSVKSRTQAVLYAIRHGMVSTPEARPAG
jgi:DNA-binding NarL/FixJ family response regulator